jgi:copper(I)-binding protein
MTLAVAPFALFRRAASAATTDCNSLLALSNCAMRIGKIYWVLGLAISLAVPTLAQDSPLKIEHGWVRAVPPSASDTVAYMTLVNSSEQTSRLMGASTPIAESATLMITTKHELNGQEIEGMRMVDQFTIPAHSQLSLAPDGGHLMLMKLKEHPQPGDKVKLTLHLEPCRKELTIDLPVAVNNPWD